MIITERFEERKKILNCVNSQNLVRPTSRTKSETETVQTNGKRSHNQTFGLLLFVQFNDGENQIKYYFLSSRPITDY